MLAIIKVHTYYVSFVYYNSVISLLKMRLDTYFFYVKNIKCKNKAAASIISNIIDRNTLN